MLYTIKVEEDFLKDMKVATKLLNLAHVSNFIRWFASQEIIKLKKKNPEAFK